MTKQSQTTLIYNHLKANAGQWVAMPTLSRIGSGKENGFVSSISKRIWECRQLASKELAAIEMRETRVGLSRHTFYCWITNHYQ